MTVYKNNSKYYKNNIKINKHPHMTNPIKKTTANILTMV